MVEDLAVLDRVFRALADPTRRAMLAAMAQAERSIGELAAPHAMSFAAASKHVKVLEGAGLLARQISGRVHVCRLSAAPLATASDYLVELAAFGSARLDALEAVLDEEARAGSEARRHPPTRRKSKPPKTRAHARSRRRKDPT